MIVTIDMNITSNTIIAIIAYMIVIVTIALMNSNTLSNINTLIDRHGRSDDNNATCIVRRFKDRRCSEKY